MTKAARKTRSGCKGSKPSKPRGASLRAFAASVGVTHPAVIKAIRAGRLAKSVSTDAKGHPRIVDAALALAEWRAGATRPHPSNGNGRMPATLTEADLRVKFQREVKLELENMKTRGQLLDAAAERRKDFECARTVRDNLLNIADRCSSELAAEMDATRVHARLDAEIRSALEALADALDEAATADAAAGESDAGR